jgi:vitamin B12 transporter
LLLCQQPLDTVVVTATRVPAPRDALSTTVTVLRGDDLLARGIATVADALRSVAAATVVQTGSFGGVTSLFLRGGESDYVKVLLDGVPLNQPGGAFDWANLTTDAVDRIEIVSGPVSVLYGSDAVTGVVQIFTRRGVGRSQARLGAEGGRYGTARAYADASASGSRVSVTVSGSRLRTDGLYAANNYYGNSTVNGSLRLTPDARTDASIVARYGDALFHDPINCFEQAGDLNKRTEELGPALALDAGRFITPHVETRVSAGYHAEQLRYDDAADGGSDPCAAYAFHSIDHIHRTIAGARTNAYLGTVAVVTGGVETEWQRWRGTMQAQRDNRAAYVQLLTGLNAPWSLTIGGRLDHNAQFGTHATGRAGLSYRLDRGTRMRAALGTGFKEPTFIENFAMGYAIGDPHLQPERSRSWEVGFDRQLGRASVAATYFDQRFRDLIQYAFTPTAPDTDNFYNAGLAVARGLEASAFIRVGARFSASLTYTYLHTSDSTGARLLRRPSHTATVALNYTWPARGEVALDAHFVGDRDDIDFQTFTRVTLPPRTVVGLAGRWTIARTAAESYVLTGRVENVLDARYEDVKNYRTPRRAVYLGGEVRFGS